MASHARIIEKFICEFGPSLHAFLDDAKTKDIALNSDGRVWVRRQGRDDDVAGILSGTPVMNMIGAMACMHGEEVNAAKSILEVDLSVYETRFETVIPSVVNAPREVSWPCVEHRYETPG